MKKNIGKYEKRALVISKISAFVGVIALIVSGISLYNNWNYNQRMIEHNQRILELENAKLQLEEKIRELTENQSKLQEEIFNITNYEPTITVTSIQPITIGPTPPITVLDDGRVSFEYGGTLYLNLTVLVSTAHSGQLIIFHNLYLSGYNTSQLQIGFSYSGITANDYPLPFKAGSAEIVPITMPFLIYYKFSESHILEYETYNIGFLIFHIQFHDFQTSSIKYSSDYQTPFIWRNQTI